VGRGSKNGHFRPFFRLFQGFGVSKTDKRGRIGSVKVTFLWKKLDFIEIPSVFDQKGPKMRSGGSQKWSKRSIFDHFQAF